MDNELKKLESAIKGLKKPHISANAAEGMKKNILSQIYESRRVTENKNETPFISASLCALKNAIRKLALKVFPSAGSRARMKGHILSVIDKKSPKWTFNFGGVLQKVTAVLVIAVVAVTSFTVYVSDIPITKAARQTYFQEVNGIVEVVREDELKKAHEGMLLKQGDIIITGANGIAVIRYMDDSVTRLSPLTELKINRLYQDVENRAKTSVEIELSYGRVWSQVVNLVDKESSFTLLADKVTTSSSKKTSFDVENDTENENVKVKVYNNTVEVSVKDNDKEKKQYLNEGYELALDEKEPRYKKIVINKDQKDDESWIKINKAKDKEYKDEVEKEKTEERKKEAGILPKDPLYTAKKLNETTKLFVTGDKNEKIKLKIDMASKRLLEAGALFDSGENDNANEVLSEFNSIVNEIKDPVLNNEELKNYAKGVFAEKSKELAVVTPDSALYPVKESLRESKKQLTITKFEKKEAALETASEKIQEAKELIDENRTDAAKEALIKANIDMGQAASDDVDDSVIDAHVDTLSSIKILKEKLSGDAETPQDLQRLIQSTEYTLEEGLKEAIHDPGIEVSDEVKEKADTVLETKTAQSEIIYLDNTVQESDAALIMPALQEGQELVRSLQK